MKAMKQGGSSNSGSSGNTSVTDAGMRTRFVLIEPSHAGNVGACARALKVMGFDELVLVKPRRANVLRQQETIQRASGANNVLDATRIVETVEQALDGVDYVCATAMTARDFGPPTYYPRQHFADVLALPIHDAVADAAGSEAHHKKQLQVRPQSVAFLFGTERFGMKNEDVYRAHVCLSIPTCGQYGSLNLAAAVQLIAYDWRQALGAALGACAADDAEPPFDPGLALASDAPTLADMEQLDGVLQHWQQALTAIGFLDPDVPKKLMPRLQQLCNRAQLRQDEVHILRGIARAVLAQAEQTKSAAGGRQADDAS